LYKQEKPRLLGEELFSSERRSKVVTSCYHRAKRRETRGREEGISGGSRKSSPVRHRNESRTTVQKPRKGEMEMVRARTRATPSSLSNPFPKPSKAIWVIESTRKRTTRAGSSERKLHSQIVGGKDHREADRQDGAHGLRNS